VLKGLWIGVREAYQILSQFSKLEISECAIGQPHSSTGMERRTEHDLALLLYCALDR